MGEELRAGSTQTSLTIWALERFPDRVALVDGPRSWTGREVLARMAQYVALFDALGFTRGTGLMVLAPNSAESLIATLAVRASGAWASALHPLGSVGDHAFALNDSRAIGLLFDPDCYGDLVTEVLPQAPGLKHVLSLGPSDVGDDVLTRLADIAPEAFQPEARPEDVAALQYSGGTSGIPKAVCIQHATFVEMNNLIIAGWQLPSEVRFLAVTPISHAAAAFILPTWMQGGTVVLSRGFSPEQVVRDVERHHITVLFCVPTMIYALLDSPATAVADLTSLQTVVYGASPMSPTRLVEALERFGQVFVQLYGQAEAPATITTLRKEEHDLSRPRLLESCGRPLPGVEVALLDDDGRRVARGEIGEVCVRGRIVALGYWDRPELTAEAHRGGWLHTGDLAREDEEGYLYLVDRKNDLIVTGGFNVHPKEVEDVLTTHPSVAMAAVIGIPDERWGEAVTAVVVARPGHEVVPAELMDHVRRRKGPLHTPKSVELVDALPVTSLGKIDRRQLRDRYWAALDRRVH